jgi:uncharacterized membrane protein YgcG
MAEVGEDGVRLALGVCGASEDQMDAIINEGFDGMSDLLILDEKDITDMMSNITKLPVNRGGVRIGAVLTKKVKALVYWCREQQRQDLELDANRFTEEELKATLQRMAVEAGDDETKPELPTKFEPQKWVSWAKKVENYLWQVKGSNNTPLIYVVRKARTETSPPFTSGEEERIYKTTHRGPAYNKDNQKVFEILTQLLSGTMAWTWMSSFEAAKNGKGAFEALRTHYDGPGQIEKRLGYARNILANTHYRSEKQYSFESYVTKLSEAFEILKDNNVEKAEREKVDCLLDGIQSDNQIVVTAKTNVRMNLAMRTSFQVAVDHLSELIGATFANASYQGKRPARNVSRMESGRGGRGGRGGRHGRGGRGGGRGGRGANRNGKFHNGVDISDLTRNFSSDEWRKLSPEIMQQVRDARAAGKAAGGAPKRNVAAVIAEPVEESTGPQDEEQQGAVSNGTGFGSGAYSNKRRAVARRPES